VIKTARAKEAETLRLVNVDKFKSWKPETKTGGPLFRKVNPKAKATRKAVVKAAAKAAVKPKAPVKAKAPAKDLHAASNARIAKVVAENPEMAPVATVPAPKPSVVDMIKAELAATATVPTKKAAALPRGPAKVKRVSDEVTPPKDANDLLEIPDFLKIQTDKSPKLADE
jgi:hypothetical protein